jgi:hypothetical protein
VPLVTSPPPTTALPWRAIPPAGIVKGTSRSAGPAARAAATASLPTKQVSSLQHQPSPASIGPRDSIRSLPYRWKQTSRRSVSRAASPAGIAPATTTASQIAPASSGAHNSSKPSSPV